MTEIIKQNIKGKLTVELNNVLGNNNNTPVPPASYNSMWLPVVAVKFNPTVLHT